MENYPRVLGLTHPFVLVEDVDAHEFLSFFDEAIVDVTVGASNAAEVTRFEFPGQSRQSVEGWIKASMSSGEKAHPRSKASDNS